MNLSGSRLNKFIAFGQYVLTLEPLALFEDHRVVALPKPQLDVLALLIEREGMPVRREDFLQTLWRNSSRGDRILTQAVSLLRKALKSIPEGTELIETVDGVGYRIPASVLEASKQSEEVPSSTLTHEQSFRIKLHSSVPKRTHLKSILPSADDDLATLTNRDRSTTFDLSRECISHLYTVRGVLEGLAARTVASLKADTSDLQTHVDGMRIALNKGYAEAYLDHGFDFHMELCRLSGNPFLIAQTQCILVPIFALARSKAPENERCIEGFECDFESHQMLVDLLREGEGEVAELYVQRAMKRYTLTAFNFFGESTVPEPFDLHPRQSPQHDKSRNLRNNMRS